MPPLTGILLAAALATHDDTIAQRLHAFPSLPALSEVAPVVAPPPAPWPSWMAGRFVDTHAVRASVRPHGYLDKSGLHAGALTLQVRF